MYGDEGTSFTVSTGCTKIHCSVTQPQLGDGEVGMCPAIAGKGYFVSDILLRVRIISIQISQELHGSIPLLFVPEDYVIVRDGV